jgi:hypothetical protein
MRTVKLWNVLEKTILQFQGIYLEESPQFLEHLPAWYSNLLVELFQACVSS